MEENKKQTNLNGWNIGHPNKEGAYLIIDRGRVVIGFYNDYHQCWDDDEGDDHFRDLDQIEYWTEIPEQPKSSESKKG